MIDKITIKCGKKKIELTEEEAREAYNDLYRIFGSKDLNPYTYFPSPPIPRWGEITCAGSTDDIVYNT